ncbi:MAG: GAF domain-containing protein [Bacteroidales bacterium]|nr:GAF domain-containing protein [Bacteroidales bacterium]
MSESIIYNKFSDKATLYGELLPQIKSLITNEKDIIANMANVSAVLKEVFGFFWVGFYIVRHDKLVLGPFQGTIACTRINKGQGVCGTAWQRAETIIVPDVEQFKGHIACSSLSKSEIVVPMMMDGSVKAVLDVDSEQYNAFDTTDKDGLEKILEIMVREMFV